MPLTGVALVIVVLRTPPLGFAPIAIVTAPVKVVSGFPEPSTACTWTTGFMATPAATSCGWFMNTSPMDPEPLPDRAAVKSWSM